MAESSSSRGGSSSGGSRRSGGSRSGGGRSSSARKSSGSSSRAKGTRSASSSKSSKSAKSAKSTSSRSSSSRAGTSQAKRRAAAKKGGQARARQQKARKATGGATEFSGKSVAELRDALSKGVVRPLNIVMLSRERIEEAFDDAVKRGRLTRDDAQDMVQGLIQRGRKQTNDVLSDLEQLLGRGGEAIGGARKVAKKGRSRVRTAVDPAIATADRARRVAGVGPNFPILGYDDLTAAQVQGRLDGLTAAELRKVRDYERRNANRKSVLDAIESKLSK